MKVIKLIRHGESATNVDTNYHLNTPDHEIPLTYKYHDQIIQESLGY